MAKRKSSKDTRPDFLRDQGDRIEKISAKDVWSAITLKHEPTRKAPKPQNPLNNSNWFDSRIFLI